MDKYDGKNRRENNEHWRISKSVDLSHLLVTISIVIGGFIYFTEMRKDIDIHAVKITHLADSTDKSLSNIDKRFNKIDEKLDILIERSHSVK